MLTLRIPDLPKPPEPPPELPKGPPPALARPAIAASKFPRNLSTLVIAWIHGRVEAVALQRGEIIGSTEFSESRDDLEGMAALFKEAVARTGYRGSTVSLVLAHPRLTQQLVETPPAKGAALHAVVRRQVERLRVFDGAAAWTFQPALPTKKSQGVLLHLLPQRMVDQWVDAAKRASLDLVSICPSTAILQAQLPQLPLTGDPLALIVAETSGITTVVVGGADGRLVLARSIDPGKNAAPDGLAVDLNRTLIFVSQQLEATVGSVWLLGFEIASRLPLLAEKLQVPVRPAPEPCGPRFWAEEWARLPAGHAPNLISTEQRKAPQRRVLLKLTALLSIALILGATLTAGLCEVLTRNELAHLQKLQQRLTELQSQHQTLQRTHLQLEHQTRFARVVVDERPAPLPAWFAAYLSEALPTSLRLTNLVIRRESDRWEIRLIGRAQPDASGLPSLVPAADLDAFRRQLADGPFHVRFSDAIETDNPVSPDAPPSPVDTIATWAARLHSAQSAAALPAIPSSQFELKGLVQ